MKLTFILADWEHSTCYSADVYFFIFLFFYFFIFSAGSLVIPALNDSQTFWLSECFTL